MIGSLPLRVLDSSEVPDRGRNTSRPVILIGFQNQGNLGIGYLAATLRRKGYSVRVFDFEADRREILAEALASRPCLIGFSLIFQFYIEQFHSLMVYLRENGIDCHFTMGGHFPSLSYQQTLALVPELDSVVRFEGEITLLDLVDHIGRGEEWRDIDGIAHRNASEIVSNSLRKLVDDLDSFPYPAREFTPMSALGHSIVPLLASRGCARTCSFCSIQTFYRAAPGKIVRTRNPAKVVEEMSALHHDRGATIFLFQDDDFPLFGPVWKRWAAEFVNELHRAELPGKVIWKMNCRADAVDRDVFVALRDAGLYFVYMGLESGNEEGLRTLHKQITVEQNLRAVQILKSIGLVFEYGFMLFDPSSTFDSVRVNLNFLRQIVGDGTSAATFCRMLPYDGTAIKDDLERSGRLRGDICHPEYDFLDPKLDQFYEALTRYLNITGWIHGLESLTTHLKCAWHEVAVMERLFPPLAGFSTYRRTLQEITASSNNFLLQVVEDLLLNFSHGTQNLRDEAEVEATRLQVLREIVNERNSFVERNQVALLQNMPRTQFSKVAVGA